MNDIDSNMAAQAICFAAQRIAERWCETADALLEKIQTPCPSCASKDARIKALEEVVEAADRHYNAYRYGCNDLECLDADDALFRALAALKEG